MLDERGRYHTVDYKTARAKSEVPEYCQIQLDAYAYLLERKGHQIGRCFLLYIMPSEVGADGDSLKIETSLLRSGLTFSAFHHFAKSDGLPTRTNHWKLSQVASGVRGESGCWRNLLDRTLIGNIQSPYGSPVG